VLLTLGEKERILVSLARIRGWVLKTNVDWDLLSEKPLLCIKLVFLILHKVVSLLAKNIGTEACICRGLLDTLVFTDLMKLELV